MSSDGGSTLAPLSKELSSTVVSHRFAIVGSFCPCLNRVPTLFNTPLEPPGQQHCPQTFCLSYTKSCHCLLNTKATENDVLINSIFLLSSPDLQVVGTILPSKE